MNFQRKSQAILAQAPPGSLFGHRGAWNPPHSRSPAWRWRGGRTGSTHVAPAGRRGGSGQATPVLWSRARGRSVHARGRASFACGVSSSVLFLVADPEPQLFLLQRCRPSKTSWVSGLHHAPDCLIGSYCWLPEVTVDIPLYIYSLYIESLYPETDSDRRMHWQTRY